tara:strand:+ start:849 stop:974 length:126 start_codon:yes stop_codon:yes gene_type:complete
MNKLIKKLDEVYSDVLVFGDSKKVNNILSLIDELQNKIEEL